MVLGFWWTLLRATWVTLLLRCAEGSLAPDWHGATGRLGSTRILEMLHIHRVSASHRAELHPYVKHIYHQSHVLEAQDRPGSPDGTLIRSYRSVAGEAVPSDPTS